MRTYFYRYAVAAAGLLWIVALAGCRSVPYAGSPYGSGDVMASLLQPDPAFMESSAPSVSPDRLALAVHREVNAVRTGRGLPELIWSESLEDVARRHSEDMARNRYFGHINRRGEDASERASRAFIATTARLDDTIVEGVGENLFLTHRYASYTTATLADGTKQTRYEWKTTEELARQAVAAWMDSPEHRANLLSSLYTVQGIGIATGDSGALFVTQNLLCRPEHRIADASRPVRSAAR